MGNEILLVLRNGVNRWERGEKQSIVVTNLLSLIGCDPSSSPQTKCLSRGASQLQAVTAS